MKVPYSTEQMWNVLQQYGWSRVSCNGGSFIYHGYGFYVNGAKRELTLIAAWCAEFGN